MAFIISESIAKSLHGQPWFLIITSWKPPLTDQPQSAMVDGGAISQTYG